MNFPIFLDFRNLRDLIQLPCKIQGITPHTSLIISNTDSSPARLDMRRLDWILFSFGSRLLNLFYDVELDEFSYLCRFSESTGSKPTPLQNPRHNPHTSLIISNTDSSPARLDMRPLDWIFFSFGSRLLNI